MRRSTIKSVPEFTSYHENLVLLHYLIHPEEFLTELFSSILLKSGERAFHNKKVRVHASNRKQHFQRQNIPPTREFVEADFYPFFAQSDIIDHLLVTQSTNMARGISDDDSFAGRQSRRTASAKSGARTNAEDYDDDEEELTNRFKSVSVGRRTSSKSRSPKPPVARSIRNGAFVTALDEANDIIDLTHARLSFSPSFIPNYFNISVYPGGELLDDGGVNWVEYVSISLPYLAEEDVIDDRTTLVVDMSDEHMDEESIGSSTLLLTCPIISLAQFLAMPVHTRAAYEDYKDYHHGNNANVSEANLVTSCGMAVNHCKTALASALDPKTLLPKLQTYRLKLPVHPKTGKQLYIHADYWQKEAWNSFEQNSTCTLKHVPTICPIEQMECSLSTSPYTQVMSALNYRAPIIGTERLHLEHVTASCGISPKKPRDRMQMAQDVRAEMERDVAMNRPRTTPAPTFTNTSSFTSRGAKRSKVNFRNNSNAMPPSNNFGNNNNSNSFASMPPNNNFGNNNNINSFASMPPNNNFGNDNNVGNNNYNNSFFRMSPNNNLGNDNNSNSYFMMPPTKNGDDNDGLKSPLNKIDDDDMEDKQRMGGNENDQFL